MSGAIELVTNASINGSTNGTDVDEYAADVTGLPAEVLVAAVFLGLAAAVGTLNNVLVIIAFLSSFKIRTSSNALIFNLSLADFLLSGLVQSFTVFSLVTGTWPYSAHLCRFLAALSYLCQVVIASSCALIAINRYIFIARSLTCYKTVFTPLNTAGMAVATWAVGSLMILPPLVGWSSFGWNTEWSTCEIENVNPETYGYVSFCLIFVLVSLAITGFVYQRIYSHVKASGERSNPNVPRKVIARRTIQKTKNLFIICCVFCVLWLPGALVFLIDYNASFTPKTVHFVLWILYNSNQAINPVLYAFKIKDFRTTILRPFRCRKNIQQLPLELSFFSRPNDGPSGRPVSKPESIEMKQSQKSKTTVLVVPVESGPAYVPVAGPSTCVVTERTE
ncbi:visual pigment-like receptor peropsin [Branchiostoma floridae x Branchiostoma japonicum]